MNYFELHIGDYTAAACHLSLLEDACLFRMLRRYYLDERPLPADPLQVARLVGARTKRERAAVERVLSEFFALEDDGWHNRRADAEVSRYLAGEPERAARKAAEDERRRRYREDRARLFEALRGAGIAPAWDTPMSELRELVARHCPAAGTATGDAPRTDLGRVPDSLGTADHEPRTSSQEPEQRAPAAEALKTEDKSQAEAVCAMLRAAGVRNADPASPVLAGLLKAGAAPAEFLHAAGKAAGKDDRFAYVLATVTGRRRDAAQASQGLRQTPAPTVAPGWWETGAGIKRKGAELGMPYDELEQFPTYRARVFKAAGAGPWAPAQQHEEVAA